MRIPTKHIRDVYRRLFTAGCVVCVKDFTCIHPYFNIPNLQVFMLMKGLVSKKLVKETCNWKTLYWTINDEGIKYLRAKMCFPEDAVPFTLREPVATAAVAHDQAKQIQGERKFKKAVPAEKKPEFKKD
ncbi:40S ribosomal protein S10, putative [Entamoeba invadens IP1]|uniref:40S ribosomal protein S10, putative n=1 Tax=Entamoeba invadens IP1 TaxID=370355 RepID=UPI0002C3F053|nr:40S ribosomal protein S10, putative [Entamoeba invadens IP1]ELP85216.1 40S ribosomal protein S10, putative [Entamoeba invadens IP1]|eukprot:XP_004184562.1 40S ribosomal protein S10, putative [Entamoeba invadens IP1]